MLKSIIVHVDDRAGIGARVLPKRTAIPVPPAHWVRP
jgi:hypothetical protein